MKPTRQLIVVMTLVAAAMATSSTDPFVGRWVLNPQQSKYPAGTCPTSMVIEMESLGGGIRYRSDTTYANGSTTHSQYSADYGGKQALVTGSRGMLLPVFLKRPNSHTVIASYTKALQVVATSRRVVSRDGQRMTITTISKNQSGKEVRTFGVYEKQRERH
jgi:hypothetical protein